MDTEVRLFIKELKVFLARKKFRQLIHNVEKMLITDYSRLHTLCGSLLCKLLILENKAINKLLLRNIYKRYHYSRQTVTAMLKICNRNNLWVNQVLVQKIQSQQIFDPNSSEGGFLQSHAPGKQSISFKEDFSRKQFQQLARDFHQVYIASTVYQTVNLKKYSSPQVQVNQEFGTAELLQKLCRYQKGSLKLSISCLELKLLLLRLYFEQGCIESALKIIDKTVEEVISLLGRVEFKLNEGQQQIAQKAKKTRKQKELSYYRKKTYKLLIIVLVLLVKLHMNSQKESLAIASMKIFNWVFEEMGPELAHFKKYLNPQIYIFHQYYQYRVEKFELVTLLNPLFTDDIKKLQQKSIEETTGFQTWQKESLSDRQKQAKQIIDFYNVKMNAFNRHNKGQEQKRKLKRKKAQLTWGQKTFEDSIIQSDPKIQSGTWKTQKNWGTKQRKSKIIGFSTQQAKNIGQKRHLNKSTLGPSEENIFDNLLSVQNLMKEELLKDKKNYFSERENKKSRRGFTLTSRPSSKLLSKQVAKSEDKKSAVHLFGSRFEKNNKNEKSRNKPWERFGVQKEKSSIVIRDKSKNFSKESNQPDVIQSCKKVQGKQRQYQQELTANLRLLKQKKGSQTNRLAREILLNGKQEEDITEETFKKQMKDIKILQSPKYDHINGYSVERDKNNQSILRLSPQSSQNRYSSFVGQKYKDNLKMMNRKSRVQMFLEMLSRHKEELGVKKWNDKLEYIKKKQEMKEKLRSTRKTCSITFRSTGGFPPNISTLAGDIFQSSLDQIEEFYPNMSKYGVGSKSYNQKKSCYQINNDNNYNLGQKSIQILMNKLEKQKETFRKNTPQQKSSMTQSLYKGSGLLGNQNQHKHKLKRTGKAKKGDSHWFCKFVL